MSTKLLTVNELAKLKNVHIVTVYRWIKGGLKTKKVPQRGLKMHHLINIIDANIFLNKATNKKRTAKKEAL